MTLRLWSGVASLVMVATLRLVTGHGYIKEPPGRNVISGAGSSSGGCPHCGNGNGICGDGNQWPKSSDFYRKVGSPQRTYTAGEVVKFVISMNVNHKGHHDFFICDRPISSDTSADVACLQRFPVMRATPAELGLNCAPNDAREDCQPIDVNYPGRWYHYTGMSTHTISYRIPAGLQCEACTLQWFWPTANSAAYDVPSYSCYENQLTSAGWNVFDFCGWACNANACPNPYVVDTSRPHSPDTAAGAGFEEFRNCVDIKVLPGSGGSGDGGGGSSSTAAPASSPQTPTGGSTSEPEPEPEPESEPEPATSPLPCSGSGSCKEKCQTKCSSQLKTNQCWGTPRYIHCECTDGTVHRFAGCDCMNSACPQATVTTPPTVTTPRRRRQTSTPRRRSQTSTPRRRRSVATPRRRQAPSPVAGGSSFARTQWWPGCGCTGVTYTTQYKSKASCEASQCGSLAQVDSEVHQGQAKVQRQQLGTAGHPRKTKEQSHRSLGVSGSSMMSQGSEREEHDQPLVESAAPQDEL